MADWFNITEAMTDPFAPGTSELWKAWWKNPVAIAEGAVGAPRLLGEAVARPGNGLPVLTVSAADTYGISYGASPVDGGLSAGTSPVTAFTWTLGLFTGSVRVFITQTRVGGATSASVTLYKNGAVVSTFNTPSDGVPYLRIVDVAVVPGDVLRWDHVASAAAGSTCSSPGMSASDSYVPITPYIRASQI